MHGLGHDGELILLTPLERLQRWQLLLAADGPVDGHLILHGIKHNLFRNLKNLGVVLVRD